jgi:L-seryl-tRNA(Ser) seleniumtransferase
VLKVHPSNYRVVGFAQSPSLSSLAALAHRAEVPLLYDLGSGLLERYRGVPAEEPAAGEALGQGADLVCFSGDKLLGGPQAGIVLGGRDLVARLRRHPVARAVRVDKMTVAALEAVLRLYAQGSRGEVASWRLLDERPAALRARARDLAAAMPGAAVERGEAVAGGGAIPGYGIPSVVVRLPAPRPAVLAARLRIGNPAVFCRVESDALTFDLRTVLPEEDRRLARAVRYALSQEA